MFANLPNPIKKNLIFKNKANNGMNCSERFAKKFNFKQLDRFNEKGGIFKTLSETKLAIVSYPQTVFSQIMYLNIPVILICDPEQFYLDKKSLKIFESLKKNKIAFKNFEDAKRNIVLNWKEMDLWWKSSKIQKIRKNYLKYYFNVDPNWDKQWFNFINNQKEKVFN